MKEIFKESNPNIKTELNEIKTSERTINNKKNFKKYLPHLAKKRKN